MAGGGGRKWIGKFHIKLHRCSIKINENIDLEISTQKKVYEISINYNKRIQKMKSIAKVSSKSLTKNLI